MKKRSGTYVLVFTLADGFHGAVGALGTNHLEPGLYAYVGSARGGLDQRLSRHLSAEKCMRWHIDRLTVIAQQMKAYEFQEGKMSECDLAEWLKTHDAVPMLKGFGCSDCACDTHLFFIDDRCCDGLQNICDSVFAEQTNIG